jgi:hypothetical protein
LTGHEAEQFLPAPDREAAASKRQSKTADNIELARSMTATVIADRRVSAHRMLVNDKRVEPI